MIDPIRILYHQCQEESWGFLEVTIMLRRTVCFHVTVAVEHIALSKWHTNNTASVDRQDM